MAAASSCLSSKQDELDTYPKVKLLITDEGKTGTTYQDIIEQLDLDHDPSFKMLGIHKTLKEKSDTYAHGILSISQCQPPPSRPGPVCLSYGQDKCMS